MEIILKPLNKNAWSGIIRYKNCSDYLSPYFTRSGNIYTGLTREEETRLGKEIRRDLAPSSDFWGSFFIKVGAKDIILNTEDPWDELKYLFLKGHKRVATSLTEVNPTATYVLIDKDAEAQQMNKYNQIRRKALKEFDKMSLDEMRKCLRVYGYKSDTLSNELLENRLNELVEKDPQKFFNLWVNNKQKETQFIIEAAIAKNIIRRNKNLYKYGEEVIGNSMEDAVVHLDNPLHQDLKIAITNELNSKS
jgi:hypothetical protein